jgi:hypothetical protein
MPATRYRVARLSARACRSGPVRLSAALHPVAGRRLALWHQPHLPEIDIDKVSNEEIQDIVITANLTQKMPGLQDPFSGNPERAWQRRANPLWIALVALGSRKSRTSRRARICRPPLSEVYDLTPSLPAKCPAVLSSRRVAGQRFSLKDNTEPYTNRPDKISRANIVCAGASLRTGTIPKNIQSDSTSIA